VRLNRESLLTSGVRVVANASKDISERSEGPTLGDELRLLKKFYPHKKGIRLRMDGEKVIRKTRYARLHLLIESNGEVELHATGFEKRDAKSNAWWATYFATKVFRGIGGKSDTPTKRLGVLEGSIIPGLNRATRLHWTVKMVIGYSLHDRR
jgi:hypothetical protein